MRVRFISSAEVELQAAMNFYESAQPGLGAKFLDEVEAAKRLIANFPLAWAPISKRTRRCRVRYFPFGLFYQIRPDQILVVSVMDLRRDPKRWEQFL